MAKGGGGAAAAASSGAENRRRRSSSTGSVLSTKENQFPGRLYDMLEAVDCLGLSDAVSWLPHGRSFKVLDPDKFMNLVVPKFFKATKYRSFQRQLNLWGFHRIMKGHDNGCWQHDSFLRGRPDMISKIIRTRNIKGRKVQDRAMAKSIQANNPPSILSASSYDSSSGGGKEVDEDCDAGDEDYRSIASDNTRQVSNMSSHSHNSSSHLHHYHYASFEDEIFDAKLNAMFSESNPSRDNSAVINNEGNHPMYIDPLPLNSESILDAHGDSRNDSERLAEFGKLLDHLM